MRVASSWWRGLALASGLAGIAGGGLEAVALARVREGGGRPVVLMGTERSFGGRVALSGDLLAVGAALESPPAVHLYARRGVGWREAAVVSGDESHTGFGDAVALGAGTLAVGEPGAMDGNGRAWVYEESPAGWVPVAMLTPADPATTGFGTAVTLVEDTILVGHSSGALGGAVEVFERRGGWQRSGVIVPRERAPGDFFGQTLAAMGDTLVIGAPGAPGAAASSAVIFRRTRGTWVEEARVVDPEPELGEKGFFAHHVAAALDAVIVNCNCPDGEAYVYERRGGRWVLAGALHAPGGRLYEDMGHDVAIAPSGLHALVSAVSATAAGIERAGAVYVYERVEEGWRLDRELDSLSPEAEGHFGSTLAATDEDLVVGTTGPWDGLGQVAIFPRVLR